MNIEPTENGIDLEAVGITPDKQLPQSASRGSAVIDGNTLATITIKPTGTSRGTALLIPGYTSSADTFNPILEDLANRGYTVISFSQRGQCLSTGPDSVEGYELARLGQDVLELLEALGITEKVHLLGHSFGGIVAIEAVLQNPERFASLTMWNSGPRNMGEGMLAQEKALLAAQGAQGLFLAERAAKGLNPANPLSVAEQYYYDRLMATNPAQLMAGMEILSTQQDRTHELADLDIPVLVSHGAQDDAWPIEMQREMADTLGADYVILARAGHSSHADRSYASAQTLATFWDEHN